MAKKEGAVSKRGVSKSDIEHALITNFVNLQKVLTNLSVKFEDLSNNISKLLQVFEISAKSFAEKYSEAESIGSVGDPELAKKVDTLLDQNKTIAKGIMLVEEKLRTPQNPSSLGTRPFPRY